MSALWAVSLCWRLTYTRHHFVLTDAECVRNNTTAVGLQKETRMPADIKRWRQKVQKNNFAFQDVPVLFVAIIPTSNVVIMLDLLIAYTHSFPVQ